MLPVGRYTMGARAKAQLQRPTAAILGRFSEQDTEALQLVFPVAWKADTIKALHSQVDAHDVDVLVVGEAIVTESDWDYIQHCHVISFSMNSGQLPGPCERVVVSAGGQAKTTAFRLLDLPLGMSRLLDADLAHVQTARGWTRLAAIDPAIFGRGVTAKALEEAQVSLLASAIVVEEATASPLACRYLRPSAAGVRKGVAWLPHSAFRRPQWVRAILDEWATHDRDAFPNWGDWCEKAEWQTADERRITSTIRELEVERDTQLLSIAQRIGTATTELQRARRDADVGLRRLITAQGSDLVEQVALSLETIGFSVTRMDEAAEENEPRVEDLRLAIPGDTSGWTAIVEVRGYTRSTHKLTDMHGRLGRFASLYQTETGRTPDRRAYVVNGEIDLRPENRQRPLAGCAEDVQEFSRADGLVIWSLDLYRALVSLPPSEMHHVMRAIKDSTGCLDLEAMLGAGETAQRDAG
jgi:hypothetical protein